MLHILAPTQPLDDGPSRSQEALCKIWLYSILGEYSWKNISRVSEKQIVSFLIHLRPSSQEAVPRIV